MDAQGKPALKHRKDLHSRYDASTTKFWRYDELARDNRLLFGFQTYSDKAHRVCSYLCACACAVRAVARVRSCAGSLASRPVPLRW